MSRDVRPPVQMMMGPRAFSRDCTEVSDIPLSFEMKDWPEFKPLQGNQVSSPSEAYVSWDFPSCGRIVGYILELWQGLPLTTFAFSVTSDSSLVKMDTSGV